MRIGGMDIIAQENTGINPNNGDPAHDKTKGRKES